MHRFYIPLLGLGWILFCIFFSLVSRRLTKPVRLLFGVSFFACFVLTGYVVTEFVINKGPDDWGSIWHAGYPLSAKYGSSHETSYTLESFVKDTDGSGSGTYHIRYRYNGTSGTILTHYNKATHVFDRDNIVPNG